MLPHMSTRCSGSPLCLSCSGLSISYGSNGGAVPQLTAAPQTYGAQGQCNAAYGQASGLVKQRYLYTVNLFAANGFYVVRCLRRLLLLLSWLGAASLST